MLLAEKLAADPTLEGEAFNFSNEIQVTVRQLVDASSQLMGSRPEPDVRNEASNEIRHQYLSRRGKARKQLGWAPQFTLDEGLDADDRVVPRLLRVVRDDRDEPDDDLPLVRRRSASSSILARARRRWRTRCRRAEHLTSRSRASRSTWSSARPARWCRSPRRCRPSSCSATTSTSRRSPTRCCAHAARADRAADRGAEAGPR